MIRLLLIRHGATAGNLEKRYIGSTDEPLSLEGEAQIRTLREAGLTADLVWVSPLLRTRQTAELLFPNQPHRVAEGLRETDFGIFEGKNAEDLSGDADYQAWVDSYCLDPIPGGESVSDFKERCCHAFDQIIGEIPEESTVALVTHGGVIMALLERYALPKREFYDYHIRNGAYLTGEYRDGVITLTP